MARPFLLPLLVAAAVPMVAEDRPFVPWQRDHRAALAEAEARGAPLLVHFRSDHCERTDVTGGAVAAPSTADQATDCDLMEQTVWSAPGVISAAQAFVPVLTGDLADQALKRRYSVGTVPTTLVADPWGNEIVRLVRYVPPDRMLRVLAAIPRDFSAVREPATLLRSDPQDGGALLELAAFYEKGTAREIAELYYERASLSERARREAGLRRRVAVGRGTNLLQLGRPADAARVFRASFEGDGDFERTDVVLFGWMMAELQQGRTKEARRPYQQLLERFPDSRYAAKARENMAAAAKND